MTAGFLLLLIRLAGLESLGQNYLAPFSRVSGGHAVLRTRLSRQKFRDASLHPLDVRNQR